MERTVAQKLDALVSLQTIDSELDEIHKIRGALPGEVRDLEDEIGGYETRIDKFKNELKELEQEIQGNRTGIKDSEKLIKKYEEQQMNVRNNREYDAITKEMELQALEIQIFEKRIKESYQRIDNKKVEISDTEDHKGERLKDLDTKRSELEMISSENATEEEKLLEKRAEAEKGIETRLLASYNKIRTNARNGLAVVNVRRGACGGCFNIVPPQRQADIREKKKLIVCEHCGRILAGVDDLPQDETLPKKKRKTKAKAS